MQLYVPGIWTCHAAVKTRSKTYKMIIERIAAGTAEDAAARFWEVVYMKAMAEDDFNIKDVNTPTVYPTGFEVWSFDDE